MHLINFYLLAHKYIASSGPWLGLSIWVQTDLENILSDVEYQIITLSTARVNKLKILWSETDKIHVGQDASLG